MANHFISFIIRLTFMIGLTANLALVKAQAIEADSQKIGKILDEIIDGLAVQHPDSALRLLSSIEHHVDSLKREHHVKLLSEKREFDIIHGNALALLYQYQYEEGLQKIEEAFSRPSITEYPGLQAEFYNLQAIFFKRKGDFKRARISYLKGLEVDDHWKNQYFIYINLGALEHSNKNQKQAIQYLQKALSIQKDHPTNKKNQLVHSLLLSSCYLASDSFSQAAVYADLALDFVYQTPMYKKKAEVYMQKAKIYLQQGDEANFFKWIDSTRTKALETQYYPSLLRSYFVEIDYFTQIKEVCTSPRVFLAIEKAENLCNTYFPDKKLELLTFKGDFAQCLGDFPKAIASYHQALQLTSQQGSFWFKQKLVYQLSKTYELNGDMENSLNYLLTYTHIKDSLQIADTEEALANLQLETELSNAKYEKQILEARLLLKEKQAQLRLYGLIAALLVIGLVTYIAWLISKQRNRLGEKNHIIESQHMALQEAHEEKYTILQLISHDLNSPLMHIQLMTHSLAAQVAAERPSDKRIQEELQDIYEESQKIFELNAKVLETFQLDQQSISSRQEDMKLNAQLTELVGKHEVHLVAKNIQVKVSPLTHEAVCYSNPEAIQLILSNLFSNAIKYAPFGSQIELHLEETKDEYIYAIQDQGKGFSEEDLHGLFKPFSSLSAQPTGGESSSGMGLYLAQKIASMMEGAIHIRNHAAGGAIASFSLKKVERSGRSFH